MAARVLRVRDSANDELRKGIATIQQEQKVSPGFPADVEAAAAEAAAHPRLPDKDLTDIAFVTIDPESSMDLDQAMYLERDGDGYVVHYAIADLAAFVEPGGAVDLEAHRRGETLYGADSKIPLHPTVLSEGAASRLPDQVRPALVWRIALDAKGAITGATVEPARVRSTAKLSYDGVQADLDAGTAHPMFTILEEVGVLRLAQEAARGGVSLPMPEQEIVIDGDSWRLRLSADGAHVAAPGSDPADAAVWGTASELVLLLYGRVALDSLKLEGDRRHFERLIEWDPSE
jgi:exoribonuclease R